MDFRQPAFRFLKAVFGFGRFGGRRSRRDSFLSFQSLLAEATFPPGKVIRSVTHLVPAWHGRTGCQSGLRCVDFRLRTAHALLPGSGSQKTFSASPCSFSGHDLWLALPSGFASRLALTYSLVESPKSLSPWATPVSAGWAGRPAGAIQFCWLCGPDPLAGFRPVSPKSCFFPGPKTRSAS